MEIGMDSAGFSRSIAPIRRLDGCQKSRRQTSALSGHMVQTSTLRRSILPHGANIDVPSRIRIPAVFPGEYRVIIAASPPARARYFPCPLNVAASDPGSHSDPRKLTTIDSEATMTRSLDEPVSVLLHAHDSLDADLLANHFSEVDDIEIVGFAVTLEETVELAKCRGPDLVVVHDGDPQGDALRVIRELPDGKGGDAVVFSVSDDLNVRLEYLEAGASACLPRGASLEDMERTLRSVQRGQTTLAPDVAYRAIERLSELSTLCERRGLDVSRLQRLTSRERDVLELLGEGLTNAEIADRLYVEVSTVKSHVHSILQKLDAPNRDEAARYLLLTNGESQDGRGESRDGHQDQDGRESRRTDASRGGEPMRATG